MWIQHPRLGAFSIVLADNLDTHQPNPDVVMLRARRVEHLRLLREACPSLADAEIIESGPHHDYFWRIIAPKTSFVEALGVLGKGLDYRNVKDTAHAAEVRVGTQFVQALHRIWSTLNAIQRLSSH